VKNYKKKWSADEDFCLILWRSIYKPETIAKRLGRTVYGVEWRSKKLKCWPTKDDLLTTGQASELTGYCTEWLARMAKTGKIKSRKVPGGKWWLFKQEDLEAYASDKFNSKCNRKRS
jgi:excisionase family DNA binding protein